MLMIDKMIFFLNTFILFKNTEKATPLFIYVTLGLSILWEEILFISAKFIYIHSKKHNLVSHFKTNNKNLNLTV